MGRISWASVQINELSRLPQWSTDGILAWRRSSLAIIHALVWKNDLHVWLKTCTNDVFKISPIKAFKKLMGSLKEQSSLLALVGVCAFLVYFDAIQVVSDTVMFNELVPVVVISVGACIQSNCIGLCWSSTHSHGYLQCAAGHVLASHRILRLGYLWSNVPFQP